ncbi:hypothetical protein OG921_14605 [Aldersonia sp. NBC_00410]|nr:hypothetical protein [Aldersonia sp. NBC_00410]MCX5044398.1 hypothetical protein [Aldersonia sp. NBC_00410]
MPARTSAASSGAIAIHARHTAARSGPGVNRVAAARTSPSTAVTVASHASPSTAAMVRAFA